MFVEETLRNAAKAALSFAALLALASSCSSPEVPPSAPEDVHRSEAPTAVPEAPPPGDASADQDPQGGETLSAQRARFLSAKYLEDARRLQLEGKLEEAKTLLLRARELTPADQAVLNALSSVQAQLGEPAATAQTYGEQMSHLWRIRETRAREEAMERLQRGREALVAERYDEAVEHFRAVRLRVDAGPGIAWEGLGEQARDLLAQAEEARDKAQTAKQAAAERELLRERRLQEEAEQARIRARVDGYLEAAVRAFDNERYQLAQDLSFEALQLDATSALARDIHNTATKALRDQHGARYAERKRQGYIKYLESAEELKIPQSDILRTDPVTWEIANRRVTRALPAGDEDPDNRAVREQVNTKTVPKLSFTEETGDYNEVVKLLRTVTGIPIILTPEAKTVISEESLTLEIEIVAPLSVSNFLDLMTQKSANLAWTVRNGVVEITSKVAAGGQNALVSHDVRDLVFARTEFLPPVIRDIPAGDSFDQGPRIGGESDERVAYIEPEILQTNIKGATGGEAYWDAEGGGTMEYVESGYLLVFANPTMQQRVERFLNDQRQFATSVVTIETKFLTITQNFLQEIGVDFRGLGGAGNKGTVATLDDITNRLDDNASLGNDNQGTGDDAGHPSSGAFFNDGGDGDVRARTENFFGSSLGQALSTTGGATAAISILDDLQLQILVRAIEKEENIQVVNSQLLTVLNNERANMAVINQTSYVRDFNVEVAQASFIADPQVDVIQDGIVLDVRPTIAHDRKHITLNLQPTVAELIRPIPTFTTSLAGATLPVTLQLPTLTVRSFFTTAQVPDGGSVLIGGLREVLQRERRAEVPLLASIPIISFLFKQEGVADENQSLAVLVTATITDVKDLVQAR
jgi:type II secretory pathway component GspD/PulD (secretin)